MDRERLTEEFCRLVEIDSASFEERGIADYLKLVLGNLGIVMEEDDAGRYYNGNCGNLYGLWKGELPGSPLLFSMHMDTVEPAKGKQAVVHGDGRITSDGATVLGADDLSAAAAVLEAIRLVKEQKLPHRDVELLFTIGEERHLRGSAVFDFKKLRSRESYVLDKSGRIGTAANQAPSLGAFEIEIRGKAAHAGFAPEEGVHAILIAARAISKIPLGRVGEDMTVNIGSIHSGTSTNIVPEKCLVTGEVRGFMHDGVVSRLAAIKEVFAEEAAAAGGKALIKEEMLFHAYHTKEDALVVKRFERVCRRLGIRPELERTFGGSDQHHLCENGISGIVLASAMYQVHSCEEFTSAEDMEMVSRIVLGLMTSEE